MARLRSSHPAAIGARIVVPVARPASLDSLLPVAAAMAATDDGHVVPLTVVPRGAPHADVDAAAAVAVEAERRLRAEAISAVGLVAEARSIPAGVRSIVGSERATLVVMGWRGMVDASRAFDATVDDVVGRSSVPLLVVRPSDLPPARVVVPLTAGHVLPHGRGGLRLAATVARRLAVVRSLGVSVLWAGDDTPDVPEEVQGLSDRLHHDPRRLDQAVGAMAQPGDVVVAAVAPTAEGLREITTHVTSATPGATLVVAIDPGPRRARGLGAAVADAVPAQATAAGTAPVEHVVTVTIRPPVGAILGRRRIVRTLTHLGTLSDVDVQWRAATGAQQLRVQVRLLAENSTVALGEVMSALHETPALAGASLHYDVEQVDDDVVRLDRLEPLGSVDT